MTGSSGGPACRSSGAAAAARTRVIARTYPGRMMRTTVITSNSSTADPAVVQPTPIRSMTGPWASDPMGYDTPSATR